MEPNNISYNFNQNEYNNKKEECDYPTEEELNKYKKMKNNSIQSIKKIDSIQNDNENIFDEDIDENISIHQPNNFNSLRNLNNIHINNPNNINSITSHKNENNNLYNDVNNNELESYLDINGNIIYKNRINEPEIKKLDSHRIQVGNNEFEDLTNEAREIQNKEAFEKKILGIYKSEQRDLKKEKKPFLEKFGDFIERHEDGILTVIDGIGCILLHGPSIVRTINRLDRWLDNLGNNVPSQQNEEINILNELGLESKEKDFNTIFKFLSVWEIRENKRHDNNNNCVICLYDFQIGDIISALPCCHVFHTECIENWLKNELSCPVCKFEVTLSSIIGKKNY